MYYPFLLPASATDWYLVYTGANVADDTQAKIGYAFTGAPEPAAMTLLGTGLLALLAWLGMPSGVHRKGSSLRWEDQCVFMLRALATASIAAAEPRRNDLDERSGQPDSYRIERHDAV